MPFAIRCRQTGGPEVLSFDEVDVPPPGPDEVLVRHTAIGVNYVDTYYRKGLYPLSLPSGIGSEATGEIVAVGERVIDFAPGARVGYCTAGLGAYSTERVVAADRLIPIPDGIEDQVAASLLLKGLTVQYLFRQTYRLEAGDTILFHAAAGGVGLIACQWARALGVTMVGTVSSDAKASLARERGCAHTVVYTRESFVERVKDFTAGQGVPVVYDSVGSDTFPASLDCLRPRGLFVSFGNASGPVEAFNLGLLAQKGSLYATRPTLAHYASSPVSLRAMATELFSLVLAGKVRADVRQVLPLRDAAEAHRALEARSTSGATVLVP